MRIPFESTERLRQVRARIAELSGSSNQLVEVEGLLQERRATLAETEGDLEVQRMDWLRERQDAETTLHAYRSRARELRSRIQSLESAGSEAPCPTCGRLLQDHLEEVLGTLREEWDSVVQDGRWWRRRRDQLDAKPEPIQELETRALRLHAKIERDTERAERMRWAVQELAELRDEEAELERRLAGAT